MASLHSWCEKQILLAFPCPITPWLYVLVDVQGACEHGQAREGNPVGNWALHHALSRGDESEWESWSRRGRAPWFQGALLRFLRGTTPKDQRVGQSARLIWAITGVQEVSRHSHMWPIWKSEEGCEMCSYEHGPLIECWGQVVEGDRNRIMSQKGHLMALLEDPRYPHALV